jgi:hypothetical protein
LSVQNGALKMTEARTLDLQRSDFAQLHSLCAQIIDTDSELLKKDLIRKFLEPLSKILISLGIHEWFCKALASSRPPKAKALKRPNGRKVSTRKLPATEVGSIISENNTNMNNDRHAPRLASVETSNSDIHSRPHDPTAETEKEKGSPKETPDSYAHLDFLARLENISHAKQDPRTLLDRLRPADINRLEGRNLRRLLDYRWKHGLSDEVLFRYDEGARSLSDPGFKLGIPTSVVSGARSTHSDEDKPPQQRVLERLQRISEKATETIIESRYYKLALYCQIEKIQKDLEFCGKSTPGVSFPTMALKVWIEQTGDSKLKEDSVKMWREQGRRWKTLCDRFTPGILEASHKALDAW